MLVGCEERLRQSSTANYVATKQCENRTSQNSSARMCVHETAPSFHYQYHNEVRLFLGSFRLFSILFPTQFARPALRAHTGRSPHQEALYKATAAKNYHRQLRKWPIFCSSNSFNKLHGVQCTLCHTVCGQHTRTPLDFQANLLPESAAANLRWIHGESPVNCLRIVCFSLIFRKRKAFFSKFSICLEEKN